VCHRGGPGLFLVQSLWDLWWVGVSFGANFYVSAAVLSCHCLSAIAS
jgi:hypothetical protein